MAAVSSMSKKRYQEIADKLAEYIEDQDKLAQALSSIREIMKFNPEQPQYTPEKGQKVRERRKELVEQTGQSLYVIAGVKKAYEKKRAMKAIQPIIECT